MAMDPAQLAAMQALHDGYVQHDSAIKARRQQQLAEMQAAQLSLCSPELVLPNQAASSAAAMGRMSSTLALQQEAYVHLIRAFVLHILTPFQAGLLCAASYPFLIEFPAIIEHLLEAARPQGMYRRP